MLNTPKMILLLLTINISLSMGYSSINMAINGASKENEQETDTDKIDKIRSWLNQTILEHLPSYCYGQDEGLIPDKDLLIRHVPCHEKGALKRYFFDGTFSANFKLQGNGTVILQEDAPEQQRCISVNGGILGMHSAPDMIKGQFEDGFVFGTANLTWSQKDYHLNTFVSYGVVHGMFKIHDVKEDKWMVGTAKLNQISEPCWMYSPSQAEAMYVHCVGAFQYNGTLRTPAGNPVTLFSVNMTVVTGGYQKEPLDPNILIAHDVTLELVQRMYGCNLVVSTVGSGITYEYDMKTGIRDYKFEKQDLCDGQYVEEQADQVHKFIMNYMTRVAPLPPYDNVDSHIALPFLEDITHIKGNVYEAALHYFDTIEITFEYLGKLDTEGLFHGYAVLKLDNPNHQCIKGVCTTIEYQTIRGTFKHGVLDGLAYITSHNDVLISFLPLKDGILHGITFTSGLTNLYPLPTRKDMLRKSRFFHKQSGVGRIAKFLNGKLSDDQPAWQGLFGNPLRAQGFMYGTLGKNEKMSGENIAYIYPSARLALIGKFKDNYMVSGRKAIIQRATCQDNLISLEFSPPEGPEFYFDAGTNVSMGSLPFAKDPYEEMTVKLDTSNVPGSGQGIFAVRDIEADEVIAIYNGFHFAGKSEVEAHEEDCQNRTEGETAFEKQTKCFKYKIGTVSGELLNIPPWLDDIQLYNATSAHKVNNKFPPFTNSVFGAMEHPRFGAIVTVAATKHIPAGDEIYVNYGYAVNATNIKLMSPWYDEQYLATKAYLAKVEAGEDVTGLPIP